MTILTYHYDADNRLTNRWSLARSNTAYAYDAVGNLTNVTYHTNHTLSYAYDAMNRITSMTDGVGTTTFAYTPTGQLASESGPWASDTIAYTYSNRLRTALHLQQPNASDWVQSYGYDAAARMNTIVSPAGTFGYTYNPGFAGTTSASSLIANIALPNGAWITNTYDGNARMLGTWLYNSGATNLDSSVYTYNVGNERLTVTHATGNYTDYSYDPIGQVIADQAYESGGAARLNEQLHYGFDPAGNLNYRTNNTLIENFQVNSLNELTANTNGGRLTVMGTTTSPVGTNNVTVNGTNAAHYSDATFAATNMPLTTTYTAIASDNLGRSATNTVSVSIATNNTFQYDGNGNLTNDGLRHFAYDDENQLIQVWVPNQWFSQFTYDGKMRRRIRQEFTWQSGAWVQTNEVYYVYDGNLVIQERDVNNLPVTTYTRGKDLSGSLEGAGGIGGLLSMTLNFEPGTLNSASSYYHSDGNGNVTMLIDSFQGIAAKYQYDAFGNIISKSGLLADVNLYRFSSKEAHPNSGLVYYLYRYYDPNLQRWPNRDPIGELGGINLYGFNGNDPIDSIDPIGFKVIITLTNGNTAIVLNGWEFTNMITALPPGSILCLNFINGHGNSGYQGIDDSQNSTSGLRCYSPSNPTTPGVWVCQGTNNLASLQSLLNGQLATNATIILGGCDTASTNGGGNICQSVSQIAPNVPVTGSPGCTYPWPFSPNPAGTITYTNGVISPGKPK